MREKRLSPIFCQHRNIVFLIAIYLLAVCSPALLAGELEDALFRAVSQGDQQGVQAVLSKRVDLEALNKEGWTSLMLAAKSEHTSIVKLLVDAKADLEASDRNGFGPLMIAIQNYRVSNARILLEAGADPDTWARIGTYFPFSAESQARKLGMVEIAELIQSMRQKRIQTAFIENPLLKKLLVAAEKGNADAQFKLGLAYHNEELMPADAQESFKWYMKAARQGHLAAQKVVGDSYLSGWGTAMNNVTALEWYKKAAEKGLDEAQYATGFWFHSYTTNHLEAIKWLDQAASQEHPQAHLLLGDYHAKGMGVATNWPQALRHYLVAGADRRYVKAHLSLADIYFKGREGVPVNLSEAVKWYKSAAEKLRSEEAMLKLGKIYSGEASMINYQEASYWFAAAAREGMEEGYFELAALHEKGLGTEKNPAKAAELYEKAASKGLLEAQVRLAECYLSGFGVSKDATKALRWFQQAADRAGPTMYVRLGKVYLEGKHVPKDTKEAARWLFKAAAAGDIEALRLSEQLLEE